MQDLINEARNVLTRDSLQETIFRSQGALNSIIGKAASEFMKRNKKIANQDEFEKAWKKSLGAINDTIVTEIFKKIKKDEVVYITTNASKVKWNFNTAVQGKVILSGDVYVNIGIMDDVNGKPLAKKVKGWINDPIATEDEVYGVFLDDLAQNIELNDTSLGFIIED